MVIVRTSPQEETYGTKLRLLELSDPDVLKAIQEGRDGEAPLLTLKGGDDDEEEEAILCTENRTFRVREIHTSNMHLLVREDTSVVEEITSLLLELSPIPAKLEKLRILLEAHPYDGAEYECAEGRDARKDLAGCSEGEIFATIQASDEEIHNSLKEMGAILLDGHYRVLSLDYTARFFRLLLSTMTLNDLEVDARIPKSRLVELLMTYDSLEFSEQLLLHLLGIYGGEDDALGGWQMDRCKVCRFHARELLRTKGVWPLSQFLEAWDKLCGDLGPHLGQLSGLALLESVPGSEGGERLVRAYMAEQLPLDPSHRFVNLFQTAERWSLEDIKVYVEGAAKALSIPTMDLIVKYCRISTDGYGKQIVTPLLPV